MGWEEVYKECFAALFFGPMVLPSQLKKAGPRTAIQAVTVLIVMGD